MRRLNKHFYAVAGIGIVLAITAGIATATGAKIFGGRSQPSIAPGGATVVPLTELAIFSRPQTATEAQAAVSGPIAETMRLLAHNEPSVPSDWLPGQAQSDQLRIATSNLTARDRTLFLFRTAKGRICAGVTDLTAGCLSGLPGGMAVTTEYGGGYRDEGPIVWGIARDDVVDVNVLVNGKTYPAIIAKNAYFFQVPDISLPTSAIQAIQVRLADGTVQRIPITVPTPQIGG